MHIKVEGPVFDMFLSLGEFANFKETMLEHKRVRPLHPIPLPH
jgi:hypothetical protein